MDLVRDIDAVAQRRGYQDGAKERKESVEDAVAAAKAVVEEGIIPGGGPWCRRARSPGRRC